MERHKKKTVSSVIFALIPGLVLLGMIAVSSSNGFAAETGRQIKNGYSTVISETANVGDEDELNQGLLLEQQDETILDLLSNKTKKKKRKSKTPKDSNPEGTPPVGPDLRGEWSGFVDLVGKDREYVSASVYQNGDYIVITTSSSQKYGRKFIGNIKDSGFILAYDQKTGEDWSTHNGAATANNIDLYDFVNIEKHGYHDLDQLSLQR